MTVGELIAVLQTLPEGARVAYCYDGMWSEEVAVFVVPTSFGDEDAGNYVDEDVVMVLPAEGEEAYCYVRHEGMEKVGGVPS